MAQNINQDLDSYKYLLEVTLEEIEAFAKRPTKASSRRIRKHSTDIGKSGTHLRATLVANDKVNL